MAPPFLKSEYDDRLARVRCAMATRGLDALVIGDPANINWLTGYDAWSFYTPQMCLLICMTDHFGWAVKWTLGRRNLQAI